MESLDPERRQKRPSYPWYRARLLRYCSAASHDEQPVRWYVLNSCQAISSGAVQCRLNSYPFRLALQASVKTTLSKEPLAFSRCRSLQCRRLFHHYKRLQISDR